MKKSLCFLLIFIPAMIFSTEQSPWFGRNLEIEARGVYLFQSYRSVDASGKSKHYSSDDNFLALGVESSVDGSLLSFLGFPNLNAFDAELEVIFADTRHRGFGFDNIRLTGRYLWMDDVAAIDPMSVAIGFTAIQAWTQSLYDPSSFHHGRIEAELHVSAGKEFSCLDFWMNRVWGFCAIGTADIGSPWMRFNTAWEHNIWDQHRFQLFARTLWGFGGRSLNICKFHGYGPIKHRSVDLGLSYHYSFENLGVLGIEYARRVYARNFPEKTNLFLVSYHYSFGI